MRKFKWFFVILFLMLLAIACGSSGTSIAGVDISGTGSGSVSDSQVSGSITQFGSIYVGGVQFDITGATVTLDDQNATDSELRLGMWVNVATESDTTSATALAKSVSYGSHLAGVLSDLDVANQNFKVNNTFVTVDTETNYSSLNSFSFLRNGLEVLVSGEYSSDNILLASYIDENKRKLELKRDRDFFLVDVAIGKKIALSGKFKELIDATTIVVNEFTVVVSTDTLLETSLNTLKKGMHVVVHGIKTDRNSIQAQRIDTPPKEEQSLKGVIEVKSLENKTITIKGELYYIDRHTRFRHSDSAALAGKLGFKELKLQDSIEISYVLKDFKRVVVSLNRL